MAFLVPDRVRNEKVGTSTITIKEKIIPDSARATKDIASWAMTGDPVKPCKKLNNGTGLPKGITVHNSSEFTPQAGTNCAEQSCRATWPNQNSAGSAVHFYVWHSEIWQLLDETEAGWHAADGSSRRKDHRGGQTGGNLDTIAIECLENNSGTESETSTAKLVAYLCKKYGLDPMKDVYTHNYWMYGVDSTIQNTVLRRSDNAIMAYYTVACTENANGYIYAGNTKTAYDAKTYKISWPRKNCPFYILPKWATFLNQVNTYYKSMTGGSSADKLYIATIMGTNKAYIEAYCNTLKSKGFFVNVTQPYTSSVPSKSGLYTGTVYGNDLSTLTSYMRGLKNAQPTTMISVSELIQSDVNTIDEMTDFEEKKPATSTTTTTATPTVTFAVGDKVRVKSNAVQYGTDKTLATFVYAMDMYITSMSGDRIVISTSKGGPATYAIDKKYLTKV